MSSPFVHRERVRFGDLDAMRHLNNVVFLRFYETARILYLRDLVGLDAAEGAAFGLIFAEAHIAYRAPVGFDEEIAIECTIAEVRRSSFQVPFRMTVGDRLVAEGHGVLVGFDYEAQKASPLPEDLRARLEEVAAA
jgi:acyl-CoA thioester hydrolase